MILSRLTLPARIACLLFLLSLLSPLIPPAAGTMVAAGDSHSVLLNSDGTLWTWGFNGDGELGDGATADRGVPAKIGSSSNWSVVGAGHWHSAGIQSDASLWTWGWNFYGQLGNGTAADSLSPLRIGSSASWARVSGGDSHTLALRTDGTLWSWGFNGDGELGNGTNTDGASPSAVSGGGTWSGASAGGFHSSAVRTDGSLWAWGWNFYGQLGIGTVTDRSVPTQVGTEKVWSQVSAGGFHTLAIKTDGTLWAWGFNGDGELGIGTTDDQSAPVRVGTDNRWIAVFAGEFHSAAIKSDGTLWTWGYNNSGQLGDGTTTDRLSPVRVGADVDWAAAAAGGYHTVAVKGDATVWAWGSNSSGQIGDGTTISSVIPKQIFFRVAVTKTGGGQASPSGALIVNSGAIVTLVVTPDAGYHVSAADGCGGTLAGATYNTAAITANCAISVAFEKDTAVTHIITASAGPGGTISPSGQITVNDGKTQTFTVSADAGYLIASVEGCGGSLSGNTFTTGAIKADCSVTASFSADTSLSHIVTASAGPGGTITPSGQIRVNDGNTRTFTVAADTGYRVLSVEGCGGALSGSTFTTGAIKADCSVTAAFEKLSFTVTASAGQGGRIIPESASVNKGTVVAFTLTPDPGYRISSVSGCGGSLAGSVYAAVITADCTVTAFFEKESGGITFTVTASAGQGGSIAPSGPVTVGQGGAKAFLITSQSGYHLVSVTGCGGSLVNDTYTTGPVNGDCLVTATFVADSDKTRILTIKKSGRGIGSITASSGLLSWDGDTASGKYDDGAVVILTAAAGANSSFSGWSGCSSTTNLSCTVNVSGNVTVTAIFAYNPPHTTSYDDADSRIAYSGPWKHRSDQLAFAGTISVGQNVGGITSGLNFSFTGSQIAWKATVCPSCGSAKVYIDGVFRGRVRLDSSETRYDQKVFEVLVGGGSHSLSVVAEPDLPGRTINVDRFAVSD